MKQPSLSIFKQPGFLTFGNQVVVRLTFVLAWPKTEVTTTSAHDRKPAVASPHWLSLTSLFGQQTLSFINPLNNSPLTPAKK